jgi:hypothetical protein
MIGPMGTVTTGDLEALRDAMPLAMLLTGRGLIRIAVQEQTTICCSDRDVSQEVTRIQLVLQHTVPSRGCLNTA